MPPVRPELVDVRVPVKRRRKVVPLTPAERYARRKAHQAEHPEAVADCRACQMRELMLAVDWAERSRNHIDNRAGAWEDDEFGHSPFKYIQVVGGY